MSGEADGQVVQETAAKQTGWVPETEFRGDKAKWVDAATWNKRSEEILPILRADNKKLIRDMEAVRAENAELRNTVQANQESIQALKEFNSTSTRKQAAESKRDLTAKIKQARSDGDVDLELELTGELTEINSALEEAEETKDKGTERKPGTVDMKPILDQWQTDNSWYGTDEIKTDIANGVAQRLRRDPKNNHLQGRAFMDEVTKQTEEKLTKLKPAEAPPPADRVGSAQHSGGGQTRGRTYSDLPADAKAVCDKQAARMVGKGRAFEKVEEWRAHYITHYDWS